MTNWGAEAALAMLGVGAPKAMIGAAGAAGGRLPGPRSLPMDEASRMARSREMGHAPESFYRGERNGLLPRRYESAHFSRSKSDADGYARAGGHPEAREFRLDLRNAYKDYEPLTARDFARLVAAAAKTEPKFAANLVDLIIPGGDVGKFLDFARKSPNFNVTKPNGTALLRVAIENSSKNPSDLFRRAGFDAIDAGRDVRKLTGHGIRLKDAVFDPAKANSKDIMASLAALGAPSLLAAAQDEE